MKGRREAGGQGSEKVKLGKQELGLQGLTASGSTAEQV